jgi:esterase/lipase
MLAGALEEYRALRRQYETVDVIGFSMGGALATLLASREDVHRLVLVAPYYAVTYEWYYILPPETWNAMIGPLVPYVIKSSAFVKVNNPESKSKIYSYHCVPTRGVKTLIKLGREARQAEMLGSVRCPTLMVISEGDEASSPRVARKAFGRLGSVDKEAHWLTARSNHHLFWDYDAEEVKTVITDFLK